MKTADHILKHRIEEIYETSYASMVPAVLRAMEDYKDECLLYCGPADWDGVAAAKIQELKLRLQDVKDQYKEACYVIGKMSIENTNLKEENNRLAVVVSAQEKEIKEFENDGYQELVDICTAIYRHGDKEALKEMINECIGGDAHERFKNHLGV